MMIQSDVRPQTSSSRPIPTCTPFASKNVQVMLTSTLLSKNFDEQQTADKWKTAEKKHDVRDTGKLQTVVEEPSIAKLDLCGQTEKIRHLTKKINQRRRQRSIASASTLSTTSRNPSAEVVKETVALKEILQRRSKSKLPTVEHVQARLLASQQQIASLCKDYIRADRAVSDCTSKDEQLLLQQIKTLEAEHRMTEDEFYSALIDLRILTKIEDEDKGDDVAAPPDKISALKLCLQKLASLKNCVKIMVLDIAQLQADKNELNAINTNYRRRIKKMSWDMSRLISYQNHAIIGTAIPSVDLRSVEQFVTEKAPARESSQPQQQQQNRAQLLDFKKALASSPRSESVDEVQSRSLSTAKPSMAEAEPTVRDQNATVSPHIVRFEPSQAPRDSATIKVSSLLKPETAIADSEPPPESAKHQPCTSPSFKTTIADADPPGIDRDATQNYLEENEQSQPQRTPQLDMDVSPKSLPRVHPPSSPNDLAQHETRHTKQIAQVHQLAKVHPRSSTNAWGTESIAQEHQLNLKTVFEPQACVISIQRDSCTSHVFQLDEKPSKFLDEFDQIAMKKEELERKVKIAVGLNVLSEQGLDGNVVDGILHLGNHEAKGEGITLMKKHLLALEETIEILLVENARQETECIDCETKIMMLDAVVFAQEEAFVKALQTKEDEIQHLIAKYCTNDEVEFPDPWANAASKAQASFELLEAVKDRLELACFSLTERVAMIEMEKAAAEEQVLTTMQELEELRRMNQLDKDAANIKISLLEKEVSKWYGRVQELESTNIRGALDVEMLAAVKNRLESAFSSLTEQLAMLAIEKSVQLELVANTEQKFIEVCRMRHLEQITAAAEIFRLKKEARNLCGRVQELEAKSEALASKPSADISLETGFAEQDAITRVALHEQTNQCNECDDAIQLQNPTLVELNALRQSYSLVRAENEALVCEKSVLLEAVARLQSENHAQLEQFKMLLHELQSVLDDRTEERTQLINSEKKLRESIEGLEVALLGLCAASEKLVSENKKLALELVATSEQVDKGNLKSCVKLRKS